MTIEEFDKLEPREVDAWIAREVMGLEVKAAEHMLGKSPVFFKLGKICSVPHYSTDLNACHEMQNTLACHPHSPLRYVERMREVAMPGEYDVHPASVEFMMLHATARQKCKAALMAVGVIK